MRKPLIRHRNQGPFGSVSTLLVTCMAAALLLASLPALAGEVYQWKDANGVTHYSDVPPPSGDYDNRRIRQPSPDTPVAAEQPATAENPGQPADQTGESSACSTARSNLELLRSEQVVGVDSDKDGTPDTALTEEQRSAQTALAEAAIGVHCTPSAEDTGQDANTRA